MSNLIGPQGPAGADGATGPAGPDQGVPDGGTAGQLLAKIDGANQNTHWVNATAGSGDMLKSDYDKQNAGYISGATNTGNLGGSIKLDASSTLSGGDVDTTGGGSVDTHNGGGGITTAGGGGQIDTTGTGLIEFGNAGSRTELTGSATTDRTLALPDANGTLATTTDLSNFVGSTTIVSVGTIGSGTWNANLISGERGGTGVNNSGKEILLGGNFSTVGGVLNMTVTGTTNVTLPTTGTLATTTDISTAFAPINTGTGTLSLGGLGTTTTVTGSATTGRSIALPDASGTVALTSELIDPAAVAFTGGTMSGVTITNSPIGASNPSTAAFTTLSASGDVTTGGQVYVGMSGLFGLSDGTAGVSNRIGYLYTGGGGGNPTLALSSRGRISFSDSTTTADTADTILLRAAANTLAERNGANDQTLILGADSGPGGGVLDLNTIASAPSNVSGHAMFFALSGEMNVMDASGNITVISPHAKDAPAWLYEVAPGVDNIERKANMFLATVSFKNVDRLHRILEIDAISRLDPEHSADAWAEVFERQRSNRFQTTAKETFAEYEARTGNSLVPGDQDKAQWLAMTPAERWQKVESDRVAKSQEVLDGWAVRRDSLPAAVAEWTAARDAFQPSKEAPTFTTPQPTFTEAEPALYVAAEVPAFLQ